MQASLGRTAKVRASDDFLALYVKGEFVGGCDIVREMYESGELTEFMTSHGIEQQPQQG